MPREAFTDEERELVVAGLLMLLRITDGDSMEVKGDFLKRPAFMPRLRRLIDRLQNVQNSVVQTVK